MKFSLLLPFLIAPAFGETFSFHHENVLGTSLELRVHSESEVSAKKAEAAVLGEIDRLSGVLNTWSTDSEISRWQKSSGPVSVSADLAAVLKSCDLWNHLTLGAFNVRAGKLSQVWKNAAKSQIPPTQAELATLHAEIERPAWTLKSDSNTATYLAAPGEISVDALAKGFIIDRAIETGSATGQIQGITLNIGGDLRVWGKSEERVAIADPQNDAENAPPLTTVTLRDQALATSGGYRRGTEIGGKSISHIFDPRTGLPADHVSSASVIAPNAETADALATIFNVLKPVESLAMADALPGVSCLIVSSDGNMHRSRNWPVSGENRLMTVAAENATGPMELTVDFELDKPEAPRYLRPYVAIWIEDKDGFPVRTLSLWILKGEKGLRWLSDLKRWSRSDKTRRLAESTDIVPLITSATRNPGKYSVVWDGLDDNKQPLPAGEYTFYLEAAREKGTYQLMKHPFVVGGEPFKVTLDGNVEVKSATLDYHPKAAAH
jgi:FAD:protein FMN transferase